MPKRFYSFDFESSRMLEPDGTFMRFKVEAEAPEDFSITYNGKPVEFESLCEEDQKLIRLKLADHFFLEFCANESDRFNPGHEPYSREYVEWLNREGV